MPGGVSESSRTGRRRALERSAAESAARASRALTSACVTSLAVAEAMASNARALTPASRRETAASLAAVAEAIAGSRFAGAAHWRAAAELEAVAASIPDDAAAAAEALRAKAAEIPDTPVTFSRTRLARSNDAKVSKRRAFACAACASAFRRAGALAMAAATRPLANALASAAAELDGTPRASDASHLWAAHALGVVAAHAGPAFEKRAPATLELAFALLNSPEANDVVDLELELDAAEADASAATEHASLSSFGVDAFNASRAAASLRAACGRLVNAAAAAVGPELDAPARADRATVGDATPRGARESPSSSFLGFASALMDVVSDGGDGGGASAGAYGDLVAAFSVRAREAADGGEDGRSRATEAFAFVRGTRRFFHGGHDAAEGSDAHPGDAACRHEAATYVQQLALFAPRVATPARLVPRLRASLFSARPALRRAAAQTLKHLCERDAGAVAEAAAADGGGLEGDLLLFVDRRGDGDRDPVAATHARRALRLLTRYASLRGSPASATRALAAVALWTPGGGARTEETSRDGGRLESSHGSSPFRSAPKLATRVLAAALIAEAPNAFRIADARAEVDLAYRLATAPTAALRPAGLCALRATLTSLRGREDPDANVCPGRSGRNANERATETETEPEDEPFAAQFQAQTLSALRAAREPDATPRCFAEGARLAATAATCGVDAGDPRAARALRAFVREPLEAWLDEEAATTEARLSRADNADAERTSETASSPLTRRASGSYAEGIVVRLRVAALVSSARLYLADTASDGSGDAPPPRASLALKWAAVASDFAETLLERTSAADEAETSEGSSEGSSVRSRRALGASFPLSVAPSSLRARSAVAKDLADAWGPCLDAAARALFASGTRHRRSEVAPHTLRAFARLASALARAQLLGSLALVFADDDEGPDAPLARPLNPNAGGAPPRRRKEARADDLSSSESAAPFAVARGRPSESAAALATRCLARVVTWTSLAPDGDEASTEPEADVRASRRAAAAACAAVARALDRGVGASLDSEEAGEETTRLTRLGGEEGFAAEARALGSALALAARGEDADDAVAAAVAVAAGLARRPERACVARAAEMCEALGEPAFSERSAARAPDARASARARATPLLLLTAVRTLLADAPAFGGEALAEALRAPRANARGTFARPFARAFASLAARADAATAAEAKRALFGDGETVMEANDDVVAALAAASVGECAAGPTDGTREGRPIALRALAAFFSDAAAPRRAAAKETAAFAALRVSGLFERAPEVSPPRPPLPAFLRALGPACASATLRRVRLCAAPRRAPATRRADVVAAAEGLKFWAVAVGALADGGGAAAAVARQTAAVAALLPLALEAIVPRPGEAEDEAEAPAGDEGEDARAALAAAAKTLVTSTAGAAPEAFRAAAAALRPESTARLRAAMANDGFRPRDVARVAVAPLEPLVEGAAGNAGVAATPPAPSFAAFERA